MGILFSFGIVITIMLGGMDLILRSNPFVHRQYRRTLNWAWTSVRTQGWRFLRWAWRNYRQGIIGFGIGVLLTLMYIQ